MSAAEAGRGRVLALLRRVPRAAWLCAVVALLNACAWSLIVPPFQGKDEADHFAYVEQLVENGTLPANGNENGTYSPQESLVLQGLNYFEIAHSPQVPAIFTPSQQQALSEDLHAGRSLEGSGEAGIATGEPPLYYAIQTVPYLIAQGNILTQLQLMRLVGALFGAMTALLAFLFIREALPAQPWAASVGGACVALQPLLGFISGSVNPDSMLYTVAAGVLLCLARAFRRGLTRNLGIALGILVAVGFLTKLNFVGFAVGVFLGIALLAVRGRRPALLPAAIAVGIGVLPGVLYALRNLLLGRPAFEVLGGIPHLLALNSLFHVVSYVWEMYLPRLPGMTHYFQGIPTLKDIWFNRSVGLYGFFDTLFPAWVDNVALVPAFAVAALCARELVLRRGALLARRAELCTYAVIMLGVLVMIAGSSYLSDALRHGAAFGEPRYLLPMAPLLGAALALAVRGAGRRWAPVVGAALVVLILGHDIVSQLQVIARYYG